MRKFCAVLLAGSLLWSPVGAQSFNEGQHYQRIGSPVSVSGDQVEVIEAFAYPCPACRNFLPHITSWENEAPDYVDFRRLPIALQPGWEPFARAYYTASVAGVSKEAHEAFFRAVHDERRQFRNFDDIARFFSEHGVSRESFVNTSQSFAVDARMRQNRNEVRQYGVRSTPTMIVQGKWRISPNNHITSYSELLAVVDYLVRREAEALGLNGGADDDGADETDGEELAAVQ